MVFLRYTNFIEFKPSRTVIVTIIMVTLKYWTLYFFINKIVRDRIIVMVVF